MDRLKQLALLDEDGCVIHWFCKKLDPSNPEDAAWLDQTIEHGTERGLCGFALLDEDMEVVPLPTEP